MLEARLAAYDQAWNAPDDETRQRLLAEALTDEAELVDPTAGTVRGRQAIAARVAGFGERFPGARVEVVSGVDEHSGFARYAWAIRSAGGEVMLDGLDVVQRAPDGRIRRVIMFFGALPPADAPGAT